MPFDREQMAARYHELCDQRDAVNQQIAPLQAELEKANAEAIAAQERANAIKARIEQARGGAKWLELKKEIADIARFFGRVPARTAKE